jgi:predicted HAD superfamily hydrolase
MKTEGKVLADISLHNKISFDLFDTIARRKYFFPDYAKLCLGKELFSEGLVDSADEFVNLRNNCENELRKRKNFAGDVNLKEIYEFLGTLDKRFMNLAEKLTKHEFLHDLSMIESKHEMVDIFNSLSKSREVSIITDSYYSMDQIKLILRKIGATSPNKIFISSETRKRKDNATVWPYVLDVLRLDSGSGLLHIGDNVLSDAQLAGDNGIQTLHVLNPLDKWQCFFDNKFVSSDLPPEHDILKFGPLISKFGRKPLLDFDF